ncbi:MAG: LamG-like jellyroll fold domain-containing protein [Candidatus Brocadiaceae bacterium]
MVRMVKLMVFVLVLVCSSVHAFAAPVLSLSSATAKPGEATSINLSISGDTEKYAGINARIIFDTDKVSVTGVAKGTGLQSGDFTVDYGTSTANGKYETTVIAYSGANTFSGSSDVLLTLNVNVDANAPVGVYNVQFATNDVNPLINAKHAISNGDGTISANHTVQNGTLTIESSGGGGGNEDTDGDGIADAWEMAKFGDLVTADATSDYDDDGILDKDEYIYDTSPTVETPVITSITPSSGKDEEVVAYIKGSNFDDGAAVKLTFLGHPDIVATDVTVINSTLIECTFDLTKAVGGIKDVNVTIPNGETGTLFNGFNVEGTNYLLGYWKFDDGKGQIAIDSSGKGNQGKIKGASWTKGMKAGGVRFDGIGDYVEFPAVNNDEITIAAWFYRDQNDLTNTGGIIDGCRRSLNPQLREGFGLQFSAKNPDVIQFTLTTKDINGTRTQYIAQKNLDDSFGTWFHVVGSYNKTTGKQRLFVNGKQVAFKTHPAGNTIVPLTAYPKMRMGHLRRANGYFKGIIDEVRIYKNVQSAKYLYNLYNVPENVPEE